jgi:hypothetical protein
MVVENKPSLGVLQVGHGQPVKCGDDSDGESSNSEIKVDAVTWWTLLKLKYR